MTMPGVNDYVGLLMTVRLLMTMPGVNDYVGLLMTMLGC